MKMMRLVKNMGMSLVMMLAMAANVFGMEETKHVKKQHPKRKKYARYDKVMREQKEENKAKDTIENRIAEGKKLIHLNKLGLESLDKANALLVAHNETTPIKTLNLSHNRLETATIPKELTQLEKLNISDNEKLEELTIIIPGTSLEELNVKGNSSLKLLKISEGLLTDDQIQQIKKDVPGITVTVTDIEIID